MAWVNALNLDGAYVEWCDYYGNWYVLSTTPPVETDGTVTIVSGEITVSNPDLQFAGPWGARVVLPDGTVYAARRATLTQFDTGDFPATLYPEADCGAFDQSHAIMDALPTLDPTITYTDPSESGVANLANIADPVLLKTGASPVIGDLTCVGMVMGAIGS